MRGLNTVTLAEAESFQEPWKSPDQSILLDDRPPPPELPLKALPEFWGRWVREAAGAKGAPLDYVAAGLLASAGACIGNARWVSYGEWREPSVLWFQLIGNPSSGKSPALDAALSILKTIEDERNADFQDRQIEYETKKEVAKAARVAWQSDVEEARKTDHPAPQLPPEAIEPDAPERRRIRLADTTIEAVASILRANPKGLLIVRDELAGWLESFSRYSGGSDRPFWLESFGGRSYTVDRKGGATIHVPHLTCGILGGIQPEVLGSLLKKSRDDGLQSRFLPVWPNPVGISRPGVIASQEEATCAFRRLSSLEMAQDEDGLLRPFYVSVSAEAETRFHEWRQSNHDPSLGGLLGSFRGKLQAYVLRLALILDLLEWAVRDEGSPPSEVSERAMIRAIALADGYFGPMAVRTYAEISVEEEEQDAMTLARHIQRNRLSGFNARELARESGVPGMGTKKRRDSALELLEKAGWIRREPSPGVGRNALNYAVNPAAMTERDHD